MKTSTSSLPSSITDILESAAACVRQSAAAQQVAYILDDEDEGIDVRELLDTINDLSFDVGPGVAVSELDEDEGIDAAELIASIQSFSTSSTASPALPAHQASTDQPASKSMPVVLVAHHLADVLEDDLVCVKLSKKHAVMALVTPDGRCRKASVSIVSHAVLERYLSSVDTKILLPHTRYNGKGVMVFAGESAQELAIAAGGMNVLRPRFTYQRFSDQRYRVDPSQDDLRRESSRR